MDIEVAKKANKIIKNGLERLTDEKDIKAFGNVPEIFNNASGMVNNNPVKAAALNLWMASEANKMMFFLWRHQIEHDDIEKEWRELPMTEELATAYNTLIAENNEIAKKLEAERRVYMDGQHELDIFNAVLNGMTKEQAEAKQKEYEDKLAKSLGA